MRDMLITEGKAEAGKFLKIPGHSGLHDDFQDRQAYSGDPVSLYDSKHKKEKGGGRGEKA